MFSNLFPRFKSEYFQERKFSLSIQCSTYCKYTIKKLLIVRVKISWIEIWNHFENTSLQKLSKSLSLKKCISSWDLKKCMLGSNFQQSLKLVIAAQMRIWKNWGHCRWKWQKKEWKCRNGCIACWGISRIF